jgi:hypothetical protein
MTAPQVDAGDDQVVFGTIAQMHAVVTDDGLPYPPGELTMTWTQESGPNFVFFENPNADNTRVFFPVYGTYVLRLTAQDGELAAYDEITVTCQSPENLW